MGYSFVQNISYTATHNQYHIKLHTVVAICNPTLKEVSLAHQMRLIWDNKCMHIITIANLYDYWLVIFKVSNHLASYV